MRGIVAQEECHVDSTHTRGWKERRTWVKGEADLARKSTHTRVTKGREEKADLARKPPKSHTPCGPQT